jgi:glycerophosphoryl diester phosphodiesterase
MYSWLRPGAPLQIVAHRGSSAAAPENTLAAFRRAIADGADAIELDVRLTADGEVVVIHDATLGRTTDGRGAVSASPLAALRRLDAGAWHAARHARERIPTLREVFRAIPPSIGINIELKAGRARRTAVALVERTCRIIEESSRGASVLVTSFHHPLIVHLKRRHPDIPAGLLLHPLRPSALSWVRTARSCGAEYIVAGNRSLTKRLTRRAHDEGLRVAVYTIDTEVHLARAGRYGVDAVITNVPALFRSR